MLQQAGADIQAHDEGGRSSLIAACLGGSCSVADRQVADMLVHAGADTAAEDVGGNTALSLACTRRQHSHNVIDIL
eukprot:gene15846-4785_t